MIAALGPSRALLLIKATHTIVWAWFAGCIMAIPVAVWRGAWGVALVLIGIVLVEVGVLVANRWRCPLTDVAARYTAERRANFDIYLPVWLAKNNKLVFGTLFVAGIILTVARYLVTRSR